jgi:hypothetical protein
LFSLELGNNRLLVPTVDSPAIFLPGGWRIVVGEGFDPETLRRLIDRFEQGR